MKKVLVVLTVLAVSFQSLLSCPTCIGRLELQSPAFFSDELYQLKAEDDVIMPKATKDGHVQKEKKDVNDDEGDD